MTDQSPSISEKPPQPKRRWWQASPLILYLFVTIISLLIILTGPLTRIGTKVDASRNAVTRAELANLAAALKDFLSDNNRYPRTSEGLDALVHCPTGLEKTWVQTLDEVPVDPWGSPFIYTATGTSYTLTSPGPDRTPGTADDVEAPK